MAVWNFDRSIRILFLSPVKIFDGVVIEGIQLSAANHLNHADP
jgi:hypothetical protein